MELGRIVGVNGPTARVRDLIGERSAVETMSFAERFDSPALAGRETPGESAEISQAAASVTSSAASRIANVHRIPTVPRRRKLESRL